MGGHDNGGEGGPQGQAPEGGPQGIAGEGGEGGAGSMMGGAAYHMASFDYAYRCVAVMEWLFNQVA